MSKAIKRFDAALLILTDAALSGKKVKIIAAGTNDFRHLRAIYGKDNNKPIWKGGLMKNMSDSPQYVTPEEAHERLMNWCRLHNRKLYKHVTERT